MDPEDRELLRASLNLAKENNRMIKKLYTSYTWSQYLRIAYWVVVIGLAVTGYYFAQPYLEKLHALYRQAQQKIQETGQTVKNL